ncbi:zf-HC2 domain-containing protein [Micromonospora sp. DT48]|uniref:zf-HC2 domain-containing protein n=1 Tax=unclassified Micromonospora TaxID=2617518 RepID=UPI0012BD74CC|nr:zf-HC2 domain-containing protein [Micromonospora sp. CP22]MTK02872.1 hypothetical protein [Micromonospora sp. CP22]
MRCEQWREILSAQLDGEATADEQQRVGVHLETCVGCQTWFDAAAAVTRRTRTRVVTSQPDLTESILAVAPPPHRSRRTRVASAISWWPTSLGRPGLVNGLRATLGLLGAVQLVLGLAQVGRGDVGTHLHATGQHLWHESAAWNVAVGAGFLFVALRRTSPSGLVPMLGAFVVTLVLLSVNDLVTAQVEVERLVGHGFLVVGYLITVLLARSSRRPDGSGDRHQPERSRWRLRIDEIDEPAPLRLLPPPSAQARYGTTHAQHGPVRVSDARRWVA